MEEYFNRLYHYPVIIFHEDFTDEVIAQVRSHCQSKLTFVQLDDFQSLPQNLTLEQAQRWSEGLDGGRKAQHLGYRHMCRFFAYKMVMHPALDPYEYYWRFDDDSFLTERLSYDPFEWMHRNKLIYGFRSIVGEDQRLHEGIGGSHLWKETLSFAHENKLSLRQLKRFCADWRGRYKGLYYYNNFEINNIPFWRTHPLFHTYFSRLDATHGFYKYRWGDANFRTFACHLFLAPSQIHHFSDIGYRHNDHHSLPKSVHIKYRPCQ